MGALYRHMFAKHSRGTTAYQFESQQSILQILFTIEIIEGAIYLEPLLFIGAMLKCIILYSTKIYTKLTSDSIRNPYGQSNVWYDRCFFFVLASALVYYIISHTYYLYRTIFLYDSFLQYFVCRYGRAPPQQILKIGSLHNWIRKRVL